VTADVPAVVATAEEALDHLERVPAGEQFDLANIFWLPIMVSNGRVLATDDDPEMLALLDRFRHYPTSTGLLHMFPPPRWVPFCERFRNGHNLAVQYRPLLDRLIAARSGAGYVGPRDLIWRLVHAQPRGDDAPLDAAELRDEISTLGSSANTTLRPLVWFWYLLDTHPSVEAKVCAELARVLGGCSPTAEDLPKLAYLRQVFEETMRLYPPVPALLPRRANFLILPWVLHRHRKFRSDPDRFDPERFAPEPAAARSRYCYMPFGSGPHVCVGASLAMMQMIVTAAVLAQRFRFRVVSGQQVEPVAWVNLAPRTGIRVTVEPRRAAA